MSEPAVNFTPDLRTRETSAVAFCRRWASEAASEERSAGDMTMLASCTLLAKPSYQVGVKSKNMPLVRICLSCASVTPLPCSMESAPASIAIWMLEGGKTWTATLRCWWCASSTMAAISAGVRSSSTATLIQSAPMKASSCTATRAPSGLLTSRNSCWMIAGASAGFRLWK